MDTIKFPSSFSKGAVLHHTYQVECDVDDSLFVVFYNSDGVHIHVMHAHAELVNTTETEYHFRVVRTSRGQVIKLDNRFLFVDADKVASQSGDYAECYERLGDQNEFIVGKEDIMLYPILEELV